MESTHRVADRLAHPLHLAVAPLVQRELEAARPHEASSGRSGHAVVELDPFPQTSDRVLRR